MYDFIVLGLVPGTQMQITFGFWLWFASALFGLLALYKVHRAHLLRNTIITLRLLTLTRKPLI